MMKVLIRDPRAKMLKILIGKITDDENQTTQDRAENGMDVISRKVLEDQAD